MKTPLYKRYGFWLCVVLVIAAAYLGIELATELSDNQVSKELSVTECQQIVDETFQNLPVSNTGASKWILDQTKITVEQVEYGYEKDIILTCSYETIDTKNALLSQLNSLATSAYEFSLTKAKVSGSDIDLKCVRKPMLALLKEAEPISGVITLYIYETTDGFYVHLSDEAVDQCTGGIVTVIQEINGIMSLEYNGQNIDITKTGSLRTGLASPLALANYSSAKPSTGGWLLEALLDFKADFTTNFIAENRYMHLVRGLGITLLLTLLAAIFGIILGFIIAVVRCTNQMTGSLKPLNGLCQVYLTVMRGTPVMVQLLIIHFVVLSPFGVKPFLSAIICFGLNSGAYVAEIVRGGIMSVDKGQIEAGRSLGFNYVQTMVNFVLPQAFKAILPSLANEFISLLKESSVAFAIGLGDLTFGGNLIRSTTYSPFLPLIAVAVIYLVLVMVLSKLVSILERRLAKSDH